MNITHMSREYMYIQMDQQQMQSKMVEPVALSSYKVGKQLRTLRQLGSIAPITPQKLKH